ncbi:MAG TPA: hypothetical protein VE994_20730 [Terriglobales bacterium]|nr:hypothetical protein [Terriglobales bacterium]
MEFRSEKPFAFDIFFDHELANLLSGLVEIWGDVPNRLIQHLDLRNGVYGFVGMGDRTMTSVAMTIPVLVNMGGRLNAGHDDGSPA